MALKGDHPPRHVHVYRDGRLVVKYRLLDQTNYRKSIDRMLALLQVLNCDVDFVVRTKRPGRTAA